MITATFPESMVFKPFIPRDERTYIISHDGVEVLGTNRLLKDIKCADYVKRVYIIQDISLLAMKHGLSEKLIMSFDKKNEPVLGKKRVMKLLKEPLTQQSKEKETKLHELMIRFLGGAEYHIDQDIADGFIVLVEGMK